MMPNKSAQPELGSPANVRARMDAAQRVRDLQSLIEANGEDTAFVQKCAAETLALVERLERS